MRAWVRSATAAMSAGSAGPAVVVTVWWVISGTTWPFSVMCSGGSLGGEGEVGVERGLNQGGGLRAESPRVVEGDDRDCITVGCDECLRRGQVGGGRRVCPTAGGSGDHGVNLAGVANTDDLRGEGSECADVTVGGLPCLVHAQHLSHHSPKKLRAIGEPTERLRVSGSHSGLGRRAASYEPSSISTRSEGVLGTTVLKTLSSLALISDCLMALSGKTTSQ